MSYEDGIWSLTLSIASYDNTSVSGAPRPLLKGGGGGGGGDVCMWTPYVTDKLNFIG